MPLAHVKWFVEDPTAVPLDQARLLSLPVALALLGTLLAAVVLGWVERRAEMDRRLARLRRRLRPFLPFLLSLHLGVSLIAHALLGSYLAPSLRLPGGSTGTTLAAIQVVIAVLIVVGLFTRAAAWLLVLSGLVGMSVYGVVPMLERAELLGIALYLGIVGRRRWSVDARVAGPDEAPAMNPGAVGMLRVCAGVAIAVNGLTEKLLAPGVSEVFLTRNPHFNVGAGFGVSDRAFIDLAGAVELAIGLLLISGVATRLAVLGAVVPFNVTLLFLGWLELVGHLPIYGIFLVLLVEGSGRVRDVARWARDPGATGVPSTA
ncbi:MAG TPA: hypothetical protein VM638_05585 [Actinomycetota bacterium]|nr:hypothetical protein [Actinomycetota bacterium]